MPASTEIWDYLIVTASSAQQARAYEHLLGVRRELGLLPGIRHVMVVPDPGGRRVGSGGSTIWCLMQVIERQTAALGLAPEHDNLDQWEALLRDLRILIIHAGGDSRRLPAYAQVGKIFVPVPGEDDTALGTTLFDRQLPLYLALPPAAATTTSPAQGHCPTAAGQIVITSGDVLLRFDPAQVRFTGRGLTGLGCAATPQEASGHGVFQADAHGTVQQFLQKPSPEEQKERGVIDRYGQSVLDVGVMSFDAALARTLLEFCQAARVEGRLAWTGEMAQALPEYGLDFYLEVCCALGQGATLENYQAALQRVGSKLPAALQERLFQALAGTPFHVQVLGSCGFLHFGTTRQIIESGLDLLRADVGSAHLEACVSINNVLRDGALLGANAWVEGCRIHAPVKLAGQNVLVGADIDEPLSLPPGACLDVVPGTKVWYIRCYGVHDTFKTRLHQGATFCNLPMTDWLAAVNVAADDVWPDGMPAQQRTLWDARVFPCEIQAHGYRHWLWMFEPTFASAAQKQRWLANPRVSLADMATLADQEAFHERRARLRATEIASSIQRLMGPASNFSAAELAWVLQRIDHPAALVADLLQEAHWHQNGSAGGLERLNFSRLMHALATALTTWARNDTAPLELVLTDLAGRLTPALRTWLEEVGLSPTLTLGRWTAQAKRLAFEHLAGTIVSSGWDRQAPPKSALRSDEIVWGRAPARLDLGGGWTDTPPYALEHGGCVLNAAVNLNGQPPIHCYARVTPEPVVRISSIDLGKTVVIHKLEELLDYRTATGEFALAKAALAQAGFSPDTAAWPAGVTLPQMLEHFGGGIELTTLAAIPKGSGLGTSSIVGAVILATVQRLMGRQLTPTELFHGVLRLEQSLTTGGGWQDQIGGAIDGVKLITTAPGLVPEASIHYTPQDVLDPRANDGCTLLYYTGITRLAKNILAQVVGRYLDRDRATLATLGQLHTLAPRVAQAMARKDMREFGRWIDVAWGLNKQLDPDSSNAALEELLARVRPHLLGAKLLGAGGGGFLLMIGASPRDAAAVRRLLTDQPPNPRARFFDFTISAEGLVVTVC